MSNREQIVVVGAGVTGLSAALHLAELGAKKILIVSKADDCQSRTTPGLFWGGHCDNFTRLVAAHQKDFAAELWQFGDRSFDALRDWAVKHGVPLATHRRLRLITSIAELTEARAAMALMQEFHFSPTLKTRDDPSAPIPWHECGPDVVAIQTDGQRGGWLNSDALLATMRATANNSPAIQFLQAEVRSIRGYHSPFLSIDLETPEAKTLDAAAVIVAGHLQSGQIIPELDSALISVADQWTHCTLPRTKRGYPGWMRPGTVWTAHHGHDWGGVATNTHIVIGGGRILRKFAGIGAAAASVEEVVTRYNLDQQVKRLPGSLPQGFEQSSHSGLDCYPCDELPIVGPMFGEGRILMATGFYGLGISAAFYAGLCLAKLLMTGNCQELPRRFWPERLRSLSSTD